MTDTAKDTDTTTPALTWTSQTRWGYASTYRAEPLDDGWYFLAQLPRKGASWEVRGWGPDGEYFFRDARTLKAVKQLAEERLARYRASQPQATAIPAEEPATLEELEAGLLAGLHGETKPVFVLRDEGAELLAGLHGDSTGADGKIQDLAALVDAQAREISLLRGLLAASRPVFGPVRKWGHRPDANAPDDGIPDHLYSDACPGTCCGGNE